MALIPKTAGILPHLLWTPPRREGLFVVHASKQVSRIERHQNYKYLCHGYQASFNWFYCPHGSVTCLLRHLNSDPCHILGRNCTQECKCRGCINGKSTERLIKPRKSPVAKRDQTYTRKSSAVEPVNGPWTEMETVTLSVIYTAFRTASPGVCVEKVMRIFNLFVEEMHKTDDQLYLLLLKRKSAKEIKAKIEHMLS